MVTDATYRMQLLKRIAEAARHASLWRKSLRFILEAIASRLEAIAPRVETIATRVEAIATRVEAIAIRLDAIASRVRQIRL